MNKFEWYASEGYYKSVDNASQLAEITLEIEELQNTGVDTTARNTIAEFTTLSDKTVGLSYNETGVLAQPSNSWYGWRNGFKPISFRKLKLTSNFTSLSSDYTCEIVGSSLDVLHTVSTNPSEIGNNKSLIFEFPSTIVMESDFYISVKANELVSFMAAANMNSALVSETLLTSGWLNQLSWSALGNSTHVLKIDFIADTSKVNLANIEGIETTGTGSKVLSDSGEYLTLEDVEKGVVTKTDKSIIYPLYLYGVRNNLNKERNYPVNIFVDHHIDGEPNYNLDIRYSDENIKKTFYSPNIVGDTVTQVNAVAFDSHTYDLDAFNTTLRYSKLSATAAEIPRILCIGDSNFYGDQNVDYANNKINFVSKLKQMFEMDKIDNANVGGALILGATKKYTFPMNYKGNTYNVEACTDGRSGWKSSDYNNLLKNYGFSQTTWDLLGLGDGTFTDYIGSTVQKDLLSSTIQDTAAYPAITENPMIWNGYFDNTKSGNSKFSLAKYLERFRTMDDSGNKLALGEGTGTYITAANIDSIDVCTPTHIVIQLGQNDIDNGVSNLISLQNLSYIVESIKSEYPNIIVLVAHSDRPGTLFPDEYGYPNFDCRMTRGGHTNTRNLVSLIQTEFEYIQEDNKIYYCPNYFTQHNADSMSFQSIVNSITGEIVGKVKSDVNSPDAHPSWIACADWAYQVYSMVRWTQAI